MALTKCFGGDILKGVKFFAVVMIILTLISFIVTFFLTLDNNEILWCQLFASVGSEPALVITLILAKECHNRNVLRFW